MTVLSMTIYALADKKPQLPPEGEYWVASERVVTGDVILEPGASVWFGAVVRGDNDRMTVGETPTSRTAACCTPTPASP